MIKVITVDREYGTGGAEIAAKLASELGWKLWDQALTTEIARLAKCAPAQVECREERRDPLSHREEAHPRASFLRVVDVKASTVIDDLEHGIAALHR